MTGMLKPVHWATFLLSLCFALPRQASSQCGMPLAFGGKPILSYLRDEAGNQALPWTVAIYGERGMFRCLGSVIADKYYDKMYINASELILTAGSCFRHPWKGRWGTPSHYKVRAGLDRSLRHGQKARPKRVRIMPFKMVTIKKSIRRGVAVVSLKKPFIFDRHVSPVCVAHAYAFPSDASTCFVSTYYDDHWRAEEVSMAPNSVCQFSGFPNLADAKGLCTFHERLERKKTLGGPLVCLVNDVAVQFGVYLSRLSRFGLSFRGKKLYFYGHPANVLERDPATASRIIQLGWKKRVRSRLSAKWFRLKRD